MSKKIIDCFTFYNEFNMLKFRLTELYDYVDWFVIVEADKTHSGADKEMNFPLISSELEPFLDKVIYVRVNDMPDGDDSWIRERFQRNCISRGLDVISPSDDDVILISDCDEVPDVSVIPLLKVFVFNDTTLGFAQDMYYYNLNTLADNLWFHAKSCTYGIFKMLGGAEKVRFSSPEYYVKCGWHFSYFGDVDFIKNKISNFAHQEYNTDLYTSDENISNAIRDGRDLFQRSEISYSLVELDPEALPNNYEMLL